MFVNDMELLSVITKEFYPSIAQKNNRAASRVERAYKTCYRKLYVAEVRLQLVISYLVILFILKMVSLVIANL